MLGHFLNHKFISIYSNLLVIIFIGFFSCNNQTKVEKLLSEGISFELATYRKKQVSDIVYNLRFNIPLDEKTPISSQLKLELNINNQEYPLYLDFNEDKALIKKVAVNNDLIPIDHRKEHLVISQDKLKKGPNTIDITFNAGESSLNRSKDYLYTLLVPDRASTLFPCFDQPDIKANYVLDITAPKSWKVLCGAPLADKKNQEEFIRYLFEPSDKMSTYLFSFVAGDFNKKIHSIDDMEMKFLYREDNEDKINASIDKVFELHKKSVDFLENYTHYDFPFKKLDFAAIPGFQYGGMEHVGAIQYRESSLFLDESATQDQLLNRTKLIAHETSHMWFGDLVTMKWFDDVWLKEVFANFLADKISHNYFPDVNHNLQFMLTHHPSAYSEDRTQGANPIKQKLDNLKNAGTLYGRIIYNKAPIMMRQLETIMGEEAFQKGMQNYIKLYADDNAEWNDLVTLLNKETDIDLLQWSDVWVNQSGRPLISDRITYKNDTIIDFKIFQTAEDGSSNSWPQKFDIGLVYKDSVFVSSVNLEQKETSFRQALGLPKPDVVIYNYRGYGYGVFPFDNNLEISNIKDDVARAYCYINLYENMLNAKIHVNTVLDELIAGLQKENNELIIRLITGRIVDVFWNFLTEQQQNDKVGKLETVLIELLNKKKCSPSIKKTLFRAYKNIAYTEQGKQLLYEIWNKTKTIDNLRLNENDYISLASILAIYNHEKADTILKITRDKIENVDRQQRFEFLIPSLSNKVSVRDSVMKSFFNAENRKKESWVVSALYNIHHPLRQESATKHLEECLNKLEEVQLTGDIFFPKNWLNATIGNYSSKEAHVTLQQFLKNNPNLQVSLKNKLLQSTDDLIRAQKIFSQEKALKLD